MANYINLVMSKLPFCSKNPVSNGREAKETASCDKLERKSSKQIYEQLEIDHFDEAVDDLASEFSLPSDIASAILKGKNANEKEYIQTEFIVDDNEEADGTTSYLCLRTISVKRGGGTEIDFAYTVSTLKMKMTKKDPQERQTATAASSIPFGPERKVLSDAWAGRPLSSCLEEDFDSLVAKAINYHGNESNPVSQTAGSVV